MDKKTKIFIGVGIAILLIIIIAMFIKINVLESKIANASPEITTQTTSQTTSQNQTNSAPILGTPVTAQVTIGDHWGSYGAFSSNTSIKITNSSQYTAKNWVVTLPVTQGTKIDNIWNGIQTQANNIITITPADYNKEIAPNQTIEIGFIITSVSNLVLDNYTVTSEINGQKTTYNYTKPKEEPKKDTNVPVTNSNNGVKAHGQLKVNGTSLVDQNGNVVVLKGMSSHGIAWYPQFTNTYTINKTKEYGANVYRAAMYTEEYGGYTTGENFKQTAKELVCKSIDIAISLDMYAIIDWHILQDGSPLKHKSEAIAFFDEMSKKYANNPAVIYEICNEPNNTNWSNDIKLYAQEVIPVIRKNSPNAIILVGSNTWSQDIDESSKDKLNFDNIMYTLHFYAGTHSLDNFKPKIETALANGCAIFVSEWGTTKADGSQGVYPEESTKWLAYLKEKGISRINWSLSDKDESSAIFKPGTNCETFTYDDLTQSGKFVFDSFTKY